MRQVIKHRDIRLLKMIRRTDPVIPLINRKEINILMFLDDYLYLCSQNKTTD